MIFEWIRDPKTVKGMAFGTISLKYWVLGPSWQEIMSAGPGAARVRTIPGMSSGVHFQLGCKINLLSCLVSMRAALVLQVPAKGP